MTSLAKPWAARSTILARMTSRYGDVYLRALSASSLRSVPVNSTTYGLGRGIGTSVRECARPERGNATKIRHRIYEQQYLASAGDQVVDELERVLQPARVGAAALGQVGPPATPAAYGPGDLLHEPSRLDALDEIRRHCGDEVHLAVDDAPDADDAGAETVAQRVGDRAEAVGVEAVDPPRDHGDAVD